MVNKEPPDPAAPSINDNNGNNSKLIITNINYQFNCSLLRITIIIIIIIIIITSVADKWGPHSMMTPVIEMDNDNHRDGKGIGDRCINGRLSSVEQHIRKVCISIYLHLSLSLSIYIYIYVYTYIHTCICTCLSLSIYIYIYTHITLLSEGLSLMVS